MSGNTEPSIKFAPMPMSALLAQLMPIQKPEAESPDSSYTSVDESDSCSESSAKKQIPLHLKPSVKPSTLTSTPKVPQPNIREFISEKKLPHNEKNKEKCNNQSMSHNWTYSNKENLSQTHQNAVKNPVISSQNLNVQRRPVLSQNIQNVRSMDPPPKRTPDAVKYSNSNQKTKVATPKIKSGIRKFTPGSGRRSHNKTPQKALQSNKESVRCLFPDTKQPEAPCLTQAAPQPVPDTPHNRKPATATHPVPDTPSNRQPAPAAHPVPDTPLNKNPVPASQPVPETPMNRKPVPASYAATPSYPQGVVRNSSKILFKTTAIKGKIYMNIRKLGTGGSSEVYKVLEVGTSCEYAVKCVNLGTDPELARGYVNEVQRLRELQNSDRVIRLHDYEYDRENKLLRVVLEVGETDLSSFLKARGAGLPPALVLHYWEEMLHAVNHIHTHGVIHADLKPANFLLVCGRLKLIDFGIASSVASDATSVVRSQATGTYSYISPEALMGGAGGYGGAGGDGNAPIKISYRSDVWSLGCILYSMVYGRTPFGHIPNLAKLAAILDPNHRIDYPPTEHLPSSLIGALKWCLTYNARARPTVRELLAIPYLEPPRQPLPAGLLAKLQGLLSPDEFSQLQRAL